MDLLKELKPYEKDLDLKEKSGSVSLENIDALRDLWVRVQEKHAKEIYGNANAKPIRCNSCNNDVLDKLILWRNLYRERQSVEFKAVPQPEVKESIAISQMKWGELKSYAKELGINTKGMKKSEVIKAIKSL